MLYQIALLTALPALFAHAHPHSIEVLKRHEESAGNALQALLQGNDRFRAEYDQDKPAFLGALGIGQTPTYGYVGCADSRVPEATIFDLAPGDVFVPTRNAGNLYLSTELSMTSAMAFGVGSLGVQHVIVMGHYDCGAVAAAMSPNPMPTDIPSQRVQQWIEPIRELYWSTNQTDVVAFRSQHNRSTAPPEFDTWTPAFRSLVDENVRLSLNNVVQDEAIQTAWCEWSKAQNQTQPDKRYSVAPTSAVWVHGFVYDPETGIAKDLQISQGPPGAVL